MSCFKFQAQLCRRIRKTNGLTQAALAEHLKLDASGAQFISNIEREVCGFPHDRLNRLLKYTTMGDVIESVLADERENLRRALR